MWLFGDPALTALTVREYVVPWRLSRTAGRSIWREQEPGVWPGSNPKALCAIVKLGEAYVSVTYFGRDVRLAWSAGWPAARLYSVRGHALLAWGSTAFLVSLIALYMKASRPTS